MRIAHSTCTPLPCSLALFLPPPPVLPLKSGCAVAEENLALLRGVQPAAAAPLAEVPATRRPPVGAKMLETWNSQATGGGSKTSKSSTKNPDMSLAGHLGAFSSAGIVLRPCWPLGASFLETNLLHDPKAVQMGLAMRPTWACCNSDMGLAATGESFFNQHSSRWRTWPQHRAQMSQHSPNKTSKWPVQRAIAPT